MPIFFHFFAIRLFLLLLTKTINHLLIYYLRWWSHTAQGIAWCHTCLHGGEWHGILWRSGKSINSNNNNDDLFVSDFQCVFILPIFPLRWHGWRDCVIGHSSHSQAKVVNGQLGMTKNKATIINDNKTLFPIPFSFLFLWFCDRLQTLKRLKI